MELARPPKKYSKVISGQVHHYDSVRQETVINYKPVDPKKPELGIMAVEDVVEIPVDADLDDATTGRQLTRYWQPEKVLDPTGCDHKFKIVNMGNRECECDKCHIGFTFHVKDFLEENGIASVLYEENRYPISL